MSYDKIRNFTLKHSQVATLVYQTATSDGGRYRGCINTTKRVKD